MLHCICSLIDHRRQNVITSVTEAVALMGHFIILTTFYVMHDLLMNRHTATWNLVVNKNQGVSMSCKHVVYLQDNVLLSVGLSLKHSTE